jgi:NAD(P)-dependent dehydrogenase (short-subunit alcohol dehydrogenase family)
MRVLITGGTGRVGKSVTERFVRQGWEVRVIGLEPEFELAGADYAVCDIMNYDALRQQMQGCQAVVHLAAIASPTGVPGHELFQINVAGTFNVFEAAAAEGIRRIAQASSINAFWWIATGFSDDPLWPIYNFARFNFWAFVDERDSAQAMVKGITADFEGSHTLFVGAAHNSLGYNSETLLRLFFAEVLVAYTS